MIATLDRRLAFPAFLKFPRGGAQQSLDRVKRASIGGALGGGGQVGAALGTGRRAAVATVPPLDEITAAAGYSFCRLRTAYSGAAVQLREDAGNTTQDFGFIGNEFDADAVVAWLASHSATNAYGVVFYDQSGNGKDVSQSSSTDQPHYAAVTINGKPGFYFDGAGDHFERAGQVITDSHVNTNGVSLLAVAEGVGGGLIGQWGGGLNYFLPGIMTNFAVSFDGGYQIATATASFDDGNPHVVSGQITRPGNLIIARLDGANQASSAFGTQMFGGPSFYIGKASASVASFEGWGTEFIALHSSDSMAGLEADRMTYFGIG